MARSHALALVEAVHCPSLLYAWFRVRWLSTEIEQATLCTIPIS